MFYVVSLVGSLQFQDTMWKCGNDGGDDDDVPLCMLVGYVSQSFIDMNILDRVQTWVRVFRFGGFYFKDNREV